MAGRQAKRERKRVGEEGARSIVLETFERYQIKNDAEVNRVVDDFASKHAGESREAVSEAARELARNTVVSQVKTEVAEKMSMRRRRGEKPIVKIRPTSAEEREEYAMLLRRKKPMRLEEIKIEGGAAPETVIAKKEKKKELEMPKKRKTVATEIASLKKKAEVQKKSADEKRAALKEARLAKQEEKKAKRAALEEKRAAAREARKERVAALKKAELARQEEKKAKRDAAKAKKVAELAEAKAERLEKQKETKERIAEAKKARQEAKKERVAALTAEREAKAAEKRAKLEKARAKRKADAEGKKLAVLEKQKKVKADAEAREKERLAKLESEEKAKTQDERTKSLIARMGMKAPEAEIVNLRFPTKKKKKKEEPLTGRAAILHNNRELEGLVSSLGKRAASVEVWGKAVNSPTRTEEEREDARKRLSKFTEDYARARELLSQVDFTVRDNAKKDLGKMRSANLNAKKNI